MMTVSCAQDSHFQEQIINVRNPKGWCIMRLHGHHYCHQYKVLSIPGHHCMTLGQRYIHIIAGTCSC